MKMVVIEILSSTFVFYVFVICNINDNDLNKILHRLRFTRRNMESHSCLSNINP